MKRSILIALLIAGSACLAKADDLFPASYPSGRQNTDVDVKFIGDISVTYVDIGCRVNNVPLDVRNQAIDPEFDYVPSSNLGPIETLQYNCNNNFNLGLLAIWQLDRNHIGFDLGFGADWILTPQVGVGATNVERNFTNAVGSDNHAEGSKLTYVGMRVGGLIPWRGNSDTDFFLNWTPRATAEIAPFGVDAPLWIGLSLSYFTADLQSGWDTGDYLEPGHTYTLAYVFPVRLYGTVFLDEGRNFGMTGGVQFQPDFQTNLARQSGFSIAPATFFVGMSFRS